MYSLLNQVAETIGKQDFPVEVRTCYHQAQILPNRDGYCSEMVLFSVTDLVLSMHSALKKGSLFWMFYTHVAGCCVHVYA